MKNNIREQVIESATQIFAENEFADVSLERIAAIAGVNNAEIAKLFSSEEKIYEAVLEYQFSKFADKLNAVFVGNEGPRDKIELCTKAIFDLNREAPYFFSLYYRELLSPSQFFESIVMKYIRHFAFLLDNNIAKGIQKGIFKHEVNPAIATMFLAGMLHYYFLAIRLVGSLLPESINDEEYIHQVLTVYLSGLQSKT